MTSIAHAPVEPLAKGAEWSETLRRVALAPLEFCPDFPEIARRYEAWWAHDCLDRPIFIGSANTKPERPLGRRLDLVDRPEAWLEAKLADLKQIHRVGDTLPTVRADLGPVCLGAMLGGDTKVGSDTLWTHAFVDDDWSNAPDWSSPEGSHWFGVMCTLIERVAREAPGRFLACTPDLGGAADVLLNLRGSSELCLDAVAQPERVREAVDKLYPAWHKAFTALYDRSVGQHGAGLVHWLTLWSDKPYVVPACDFNFLIGPEQFNDLFLPDIARQCATVGRAVFHLDGPGAARHIDALLEIPDLDAIQFTPGTGTPSALAWVDMFRKIQARGRSLLVITPAAEVLPLCEALSPEGLALIVDDPSGPDALEGLFGEFGKHFRR
jgi:hypothetical protein